MSWLGRPGGGEALRSGKGGCNFRVVGREGLGLREAVKRQVDFALAQEHGPQPEMQSCRSRMPANGRAIFAGRFAELAQGCTTSARLAWPKKERSLSLMDERR